MIKKILLGLALTTGLMMANTTTKDDLLSLVKMVKADGAWYIRGYHQNRMNKIASYIKPKPYTPTPKSPPRVQEVKKTYHLGIGKSVYMTPTAFKSYLARNY